MYYSIKIGNRNIKLLIQLHTRANLNPTLRYVYLAGNIMSSARSEIESWQYK